MANETDVKEIWRGSQILSCIRCAEKKEEVNRTIETERQRKVSCSSAPNDDEINTGKESMMNSIDLCNVLYVSSAPSKEICEVVLSSYGP